MRYLRLQFLSFVLFSTQAVAILLILTLAHGSSAANRLPVPVIFDTDMESDVDDVGALAMLHSLADSGEAEILGVMVGAKNPWSVLCADRINTYFGRANLPLGQLKGTGRDTTSRYAQEMAQEFPGTLHSADDAPDAVDQYRAILASQPDDSVVIVSVGYLTNMRDLLASEPDAHSDLDGQALVEKKVQVWVCMGGEFPSGREANLRGDIPASIEAIDNWPTEIIFAGWEVGRMLTAFHIRNLPDSNPVRRAYELFDHIPHYSWDQVAALYAARGIDNGPSSSHWELSDPGRIVVDSDGRNTWQNDPTGTHRHLIQVGEDAEIAQEIDFLMMHVPEAVNPAQYLVTIPETAPGVNESILVVAQLADANGHPVMESGRAVSWSSTNGGEFSEHQALTDESGATAVTFTTSATPDIEHILSATDGTDPDITGTSSPFFTLDKTPAGLIAYYPLTEGTGTTAGDRSGFGEELNLALLGNVQWLSDRNGVVFDGSTSLLHSEGAALKLHQRITLTEEFSLTAWVKPNQSSQDGPARIITYSGGTSARMFTLGHGRWGEANNDLTFRLRTAETNENGEAEIGAEDALFTDQPQHLVVTFEGSIVRIYRDGEKIHSKAREGGLSNWDESFPLVLGAEANDDRHWAGEMYQVAIYDRELTPSEIQSQFAAGEVALLSDTGNSNPFRSWAASYFDDLDGAEAQPKYDANGSGRPNAIEFLLGMDPTAVEPAPNTRVETSENGLLQFTYPAVRRDHGFSLEFSISHDLVTWSPLPTESFDLIIKDSDMGEEFEKIVIRSKSTDDPEMAFSRLTVPF